MQILVVNVWVETLLFAARTYKIATTGILSALAYFFLILAGSLPTSRLFLFALAGVIMAICTRELGLKYALLSLLVLLALVLVFPGLIKAALFLSFFAPYAIFFTLTHEIKLLFMMRLNLGLAILLLDFYLLKLFSFLTPKALEFAQRHWYFGLLGLILAVLANEYLLRYSLEFYEERIRPYWRNKIEG